MEEYKKYLADQILSEERIVSLDAPYCRPNLILTNMLRSHIGASAGHSKFMSIRPRGQFYEHVPFVWLSYSPLHRMLYEFHRSQNGMRPGTIHATYTVYGIQKVEKTQEDGDVEMTSSPPDVESLSDEVVTHSMTLVSGERLKGITISFLSPGVLKILTVFTEVLATYEDVSSFYIYSLARHPTRVSLQVQSRNPMLTSHLGIANVGRRLTTDEGAVNR